MRQRHRNSAPNFRKHKQSGRAIVKLFDAVTGKRRDIPLGEYDSPESHAQYAKVLAE